MERLPHGPVLRSGAILRVRFKGDKPNGTARAQALHAILVTLTGLATA